MIMSNALVVLLLSFICSLYSYRVLELQGVNIELVITNYKYVAVLFYDKSSQGSELLKTWEAAASLIKDMKVDSEIGKVG